VRHVDERQTTCDSCIAYRFKEKPNGSEVDYVGIIEEILEVDFRSFKTYYYRCNGFATLFDRKIACSTQSTPLNFLGMAVGITSLSYFRMKLNKSFFSKDRLNPKRSFVLQDNPKCHIILDKLLKALKTWTNGSEVVSLLVSDRAPKSPPTNEGLECAEEKEDANDALEDEDEREIGGALTLSRNEIENLM
jgi:hypothetical protein